MLSRLRTALVVDALPFRGGAEKVLEAVLELLPGAPIYTHIYNPSAFHGTIIERHRVHTSFINRLPFSARHHRSYLPFYPLATEQIDLSEYDLILSFSYAVAHGILSNPDQVHITYKYTVMRHAWHGYQDFLRYRRSRLPITSWTARLILHYFRLWDAASSGRVDQFIAVSNWVAESIQRIYRRHARVVYPPVNVDSFQRCQPRSNYYLAISRLEAHKRVDVLIEAFSRLGYPLLIIGEGSLHRHLAQMAGPNVKLLGRVSDRELSDYLSQAKAFVHAAVEDFGIAIVEAQAAGCPVIAYGKGGVLETIIDGETGVTFPEQDASSLMEAVIGFEQDRHRFTEGAIRRQAMRFNKQRFLQEYCSNIESVLSVKTRPDQQ